MQYTRVLQEDGRQTIGNKFAALQRYNGSAPCTSNAKGKSNKSSIPDPGPSDILNFSRLIFEGKLDINALRTHDGALTYTSLAEIVDAINPKVVQNSTSKSAAPLRAWLLELYDVALGGTCECHAFNKALLATGGVLEASCPHGFKVGFLHLFEVESVRHVAALLRSLVTFPRLVVYDASCGLVSHFEAVYKDEAQKMWGNRRGCFSEWHKEGPSNLRPIERPSLSGAYQRKA
eukprot:CAMPEP_0195599472 /NCGR_PEP_ID=MMETSP0815-20121206/4051_1 /TAXON_ID=97485 /ORGANISM="Prymnesium parvum, Strain Texoma1" /LENGTH=232 /DNA_ID=CAMNT_0040738911 /DNA_START=219 /DNA_END=913 /DNA_ORIENTATION=-